MTKMILLSFVIANWAVAASSPLFGVYRGQISTTQSCTLSILENKENQVVSFLIDQNPFVFVSSIQLLGLLSQRGSQIAIASVENNAHDSVEIIFDSKSKFIEVITKAGGVTAKCSKAFQIRQQD